MQLRSTVSAIALFLAIGLWTPAVGAQQATPPFECPERLGGGDLSSQTYNDDPDSALVCYYDHPEMDEDILLFVLWARPDQDPSESGTCGEPFEFVDDNGEWSRLVTDGDVAASVFLYVEQVSLVNQDQLATRADRFLDRAAEFAGSCTAAPVTTTTTATTTTTTTVAEATTTTMPETTTTTAAATTTTAAAAVTTTTASPAAGSTIVGAAAGADPDDDGLGLPVMLGLVVGGAVVLGVGGGLLLRRARLGRAIGPGAGTPPPLLQTASTSPPPPHDAQGPAPPPPPPAPTSAPAPPPPPSGGDATPATDTELPGGTAPSTDSSDTAPDGDEPPRPPAPPVAEAQALTEPEVETEMGASTSDDRVAPRGEEFPPPPPAPEASSTPDTAESPPPPPPEPEPTASGGDPSDATDSIEGGTSRPDPGDPDARVDDKAAPPTPPEASSTADDGGSPPPPPPPPSGDEIPPPPPPPG